MPNKLVLAVIPARSGSKSIPRKNLQKIHNISLTKYALFSAQLNDLITHIALSSDSDEIKLRHEDVTKLIYKNHTFEVRILQLYKFLEGLLSNSYCYGAFKNGTFSISENIHIE
jgi:hypothetical protein